MGWREDGRRLKEGGIKWSDRGKVKRFITEGRMKKELNT